MHVEQICDLCLLFTISCVCSAVDPCVTILCLAYKLMFELARQGRTAKVDGTQ